MKPLFQLVVQPKEGRYNNTKTVDGSPLIINATIDDKDFRYTNRIGVVLTTPLYDSPYEVGDNVIVHHNAFRQYWGFDTHLRTSTGDLGDDKFAVSPDQIFAYKRGDSDWVMTDDWVFVTPIEAPEVDIMYDLGGKLPLRGKLAYGSVDHLKRGDTVAFTPHSEYEFNIDGTLFYKMNKNDITANIF